MAKPILFGDNYFKSKNAATKEIRDRISKYEAEENLNKEDEFFFARLFELHSEYEEKIGCGISHIQVRKDFHNNKCLYIHRMDGTFTDISWVHCVQPASQKTILSYAFRRAIKEIIIEFKHTQLKNSPCCPILHIPLDFYNSHVSYTTPRFDKLFLNFLEEYDHTICSIELKNPDKNDTDPRGIIKDPIIRNNWINYHKSNAQLELISEKANLSKKYKI